ncbi:LuxR C-terminal-related transcriptional regulator [Pseudolysinimonas sp.]
MPAQDQGSPASRVAAVLGDPHEGALLVTGAPGAGKSHLLEVAAASSPIPVVVARGNPVERELALSGLGAVLAAVDTRAADFAGRFTLRSADRLAIPAAAADILALLRGLRIDDVALLIDDIDEMDAASRGLLGFMAGRLGGTGVRLVVTATKVGGKDPLAGLPRVRLPALRTGEALALALDAGGPDFHEGTARILVAHSAGNPATLLARVRTLRRSQRVGRASLPFPFAVRRAGRRIARHVVDRLDEGALDLVRALSVAPLAHPAALVDAGLISRDELDDLVNTGVVERVDRYVRLRNPIVRSAVFAALSARRRRDLHATLAERSAPHATVLRDWHAAAIDPSGPRAGRLLRGALELLDDGLVAAAVEVADVALGRHGDLPAPDDALAFAGRLLHRGEGALAERCLLLLEARGLPHPERSTVALARLQTEVERTGRAAHTAVLSAVELHGEVAPSPTVRLLATTALWHCLRGEVRSAHELVALAEAVRGDVDDGARRLLRAVADLATAGTPARRHPEPVDVAGASTAELLALARAESLREDYDAAARLYALAVDTAPDDPGWRDLGMLLAADNAVRAGWVEEGLAAVARVRELGIGDHLLPLQVLLEAWAEIAHGDIGAARERLRAWLSGSHGTEGLTGAGVHALLGWIALTRNEPDAAVRELSHADLLAGDADPGIVRHHPLLIDALVAAGRIDAARAALDRFESGAGRFPGRWTSIAIAGARAVVAQTDASGQLFDRALGSLGPTDPPLERARLLLRKGQRMRATGAPGAESVMLQARAAFEAIGASAWYPVDDDEPIPRSGGLLDLLTDSEAEVARLVRLGLQNKEIASRLFVSLRTVELRLTNIYRKTGTRSRSQLVAALS